MSRFIEKIVICGPSGSGKSTLIRCLNALEFIEQGEIYVDKMKVFEQSKDLEKLRSEVGMVFQHFNLFENLSVLENCTIAQINVLKKSKNALLSAFLFNKFSCCISSVNNFSFKSKNLISLSPEITLLPVYLLKFSSCDNNLSA